MIHRRQIPQLHGLTKNGTKHPIYRLRDRLMSCCYTIKSTHPSYPYYRGKGIIVDDKWRNSVMDFYNWCINNGWQKGLSIDRINSDGNYEPSNCRFITKGENSKKARRENNQSGENGSNAKLTYKKVNVIRLLLNLNYPIYKIAEFFGVGATAISYIKHGKSWNCFQGELNAGNATVEQKS